MIYSDKLKMTGKKKVLAFSFALLSLCSMTSVAQGIYYVSPDGTGDGSSWDKTSSLVYALEKAVAGDEIWLKGFSEISDKSQVYLAPDEGFVLRSGVSLYGGFQGTEERIDQRQTLGKAYQMAYRSVLSGDKDDNDEVDPVTIIFPQNGTRADNSKSVLVMNAFRNLDTNLNDNSVPTVVNGVTIYGGHNTVGNGGGIVVKGGASSVPYAIECCYLLNNYAQKGGAIYVESTVKAVETQSLISQSVVYNNVAGNMVGKDNNGGGVYLDGAGNIVNTSIFNNENGGTVLSDNSYLVNSVVARNTGGGVDMVNNTGTKANVFNSVVWGNSFLSANSIKQPIFFYSAFTEATEGENNNIKLSKNNRGDERSPMFDAPSLRTGFDVDQNQHEKAYPLWSWKLVEGSMLIDKGDDASYEVYAKGRNGVVGYDLAGDTRIIGSIDINTYEFQVVPSSRIRYVRTDGDDKNSGTSWAEAYKTVQKAINSLAERPGVAGEVWIAAGIYEPTELIDGMDSPGSFRMRDGISVYGGFKGDETSKTERLKNENSRMPWDYTNKTILRGNTFNGKNTWIPEDNKWSLSGTSTHVVWFAPLNGENDFKSITVLDGVIIEGGKAYGSDSNTYSSENGAGVYIKGSNAYLNNSVIRNNVALSDGGGVYLKGGRVLGCLVFNNSSETRGGGIYVDNSGFVTRSVITNNSALDGGGIFLDNNALQSDGKNHPEYQILSTSVVSNNTSVRNGAVFCNNGGIIMHTTVTNNNTPTATDNASGKASHTGGLYVNAYAKVVNSVFWNNLVNERNVQIYASNPTTENVGFFNSAVSSMNNIIWNNTLQQNMVSLTEKNLAGEGLIDPGFIADGMPSVAGVIGDKTDIDYFWIPVQGSNLRAKGMQFGLLPSEVLLAPELDIRGDLFAQKPAIGAFSIQKTVIEPEITDSYIRIYVDTRCTEVEHRGKSWATAYRSLNEAVEYMSLLDAGFVNGRSLEIYVMEDDISPAFSSVNLDPKTVTIEIPEMASGSKLLIKGGFSRTNHGEWNPLAYRTVINGNVSGKNLNEGLYHCITVEKNVKVEFDGIHVINGYALGANLKYGAGMLVREGSEVSIKNSIFENNTAYIGAAIDARDAKLTMTNCVVNNNTNATDTEQIINCSNLTLNFVTVANNIGAAPQNIGKSSFAAGNTSNNNFTGASTGAEGYKNFTNPTNNAGATLGYDTYLGGYSDFTPLTSSVQSGLLINTVADADVPAGIEFDIAGNKRSLGGASDRGAYEANLPENGTVIYVTQTGAGLKDGSSWNNAIAGNMIYDLTSNTNIGIQTTDSRYVGFYDANSRPYAETSGASKLFYEHLNEQNLTTSNVNYKTENHDGVTHVTGANGINIRNNRQERYVGGLQYAVEVAALAASNDGKQRTVWVAGGTYTDYKGFVIRDKVDVLGGFPNEGIPGESDRHPLISQYIPANIADAGLDKTKYETIIQIQSVKPWTYNSQGNPGANPAANLPERTRKPVLYQPDVCVPTMSPTGRESSYNYWNWGRSWGDWSNHWINNGYGNSVPGADENASNTYRYNRSVGQQNGTYIGYSGAMWDGFTIRHGFYTDYKANRDGGAGVRMFRGVTLQNCVVTDNYINAHNNAGRGAGIYCDGDNSKIVNCFVLNNANNSDESYGGGMYMILGTSYNTLVANNYAKTSGGGIFIEDAMFYNNTVAYNKSNGTGGLHQWTASSGTTTTLKLYNTIFYGNSGKAIGVSSVNNFNGAWNCYVQTASNLDAAVQNKIKNSQIGTNLAIPFEDSQAQKNNNYRLNATTWCLNNGEENLGNDYQGKPVVLPYTDVDFTDRIKDCSIDVGAYERTNEENIKCDVNGIYYVTQNGSGNSEGSSPSNAACAMKLQDILNAAGRRVLDGNTATVKIAGYEGESFVYHANALSDPNDPKSYTFVIPYGVTVMGGYDDESTDWSNDKRDAYTNMTILSPVATVGEQTVEGYHAVTFGEKTGTGNLKTTLDGLYLKYGKANSMAGAGNKNTIGGGAIVPEWGHIRNCVISDCEAIQGGGLYLMPGATVSGCGIFNNKADEGGGIFADNMDAGPDKRAHLISNTITDNTALETGGGVYIEDGAAMFSNTIIWGNNSASDKNISGVVSQTYQDNNFYELSENSVEELYPFNHCFVETYELPSNLENSSMQSDEALYFAKFRRLKAYSELVKHGMEKEYQNHFKNILDISDFDMNGNARNDAYSLRIDAGAYAFNGGFIPLPDSEDKIIRRIFVSQKNSSLVSESLDECIGRSFYSPLSWLDDALEYIRRVKAVESFKNVDFEVLVSGGTYKPNYRRTDAGTGEIDQRQNSFVIPAGVSIYGGFTGQEQYSYQISSVQTDDGYIMLDPNTDLKTILAKRAYSDLNGNGINEDWEFANQTVFSGDINVSSQIKNAYHVVYSDQSADDKGVLLDGVTIKDGETFNIMSDEIEKDEVGRGGAIYTNGVPYILKGCRIMDCKGVRGGAIYSRNADITIIGSVIANNGTVDNPQTAPTQDVRGGAVYMSGYDKDISFKAINTLWANNETYGFGGAIATSGSELSGHVSISLMNNTIVRNKAANYSAIYAPHGGEVVNSVIWGGEGDMAVSEELQVSYSASDNNITGSNNIKLDETNMSITGPRFVAPSNIAGMSGYDISAKWNPSSISVLTDAGNGQLDYETSDDAYSSATGAYKEWINSYIPEYINSYMDGDDYYRYKGPRPLKGEDPEPKKIDIGVYEYQYKAHFLMMDEIYVDLEERGDGSGDSWGNATSDLRGAIIALSSPEGGNSTDKKIYIRGGVFSQSQLYIENFAYKAVLSPTNDYVTSLKIIGSYAENGNQDFSNPTVFQSTLPSESVEAVFYVNTNGKKLTFEGITFKGGKKGLYAQNTSGTLNLKNVAFRESGTGAYIEGTNGNTLFANTLFADNENGLYVNGTRTKIVNATFANNISALIGTGMPEIYNSVSWKSGQEIIEDATKCNVNLGDVMNNDILNGPNFVDPDNGNYMIRPSIKLVNLANATWYNNLLGENASETDKDLGGNIRTTDNLMDIGAYEYNAALQPIVFVKYNVVNTDESGSSWENPIRDLQGAIDLAAVYSNKNAGKTATVFVHKDINNVKDIHLSMPNVRVYGGMNDEPGTDVVTLLEQRSSVLSDNMSSIEDLELSGESCLIDGFKLSGEINVDNAMISTSVLTGDANIGINGIVYNSFIDGQLTGNGYAVNVTCPHMMDVVNKINVIENAVTNRYVTYDIWKYQLNEDSPFIDNIDSHDISSYISKAGHSRDLSGSPRLRGKADFGCFETWKITENNTLTSSNYMTDKHVLYVENNVEFDLAKGLYNDDRIFNAGFVLLKHGAGLRSNGNNIALTNFAVERQLNADNHHWDMSYMPFNIVKVEGNDGVSVKTYDGEKRAAYDYKFNDKNGAWKDSQIKGGIGMMMQSASDATVRMYGDWYEESADESRDVYLMKYNNMQPWSSSDDNSIKFTHLENMSWNMFGSPFLCAMNYDDMEYGRVIYKKNNDTYVSVNTMTSSGSIEAGSAVLTQTATLQTGEIFSVAQRTNEKNENINEFGTLVIGISKSTTDVQDEMALKAVPTEESSSEFNMAADGVKMMSVSDEASQIYIERSGKRYSMLSAVDIEGTVSVGLNIKEAGMFAISVPEECDAAEYETVVLTDKSNGNVVDLLDAPYEFTSAESGDITGRFTIQFNLNGSNDGSNLNVYSDSYGAVIVEGLADGMNIRMYDASGKMVAARKAVSPVERFTECESGVYLVQILVNEGEPKVFKVHVR